MFKTCNFLRLEPGPIYKIPHAPSTLLKVNQPGTVCIGMKNNTYTEDNETGGRGGALFCMITCGLMYMSQLPRSCGEVSWAWSARRHRPKSRRRSSRCVGRTATYASSGHSRRRTERAAPTTPCRPVSPGSECSRSDLLSFPAHLKQANFLLIRLNFNTN